MTVGIIGLGFVGGSMIKSFKLKGINCVGYDSYKKIEFNKKFIGVALVRTIYSDFVAGNSC